MFKKIQRLMNSAFKQEYVKASIYYVVANIAGQGIVLISAAVFTRMMSKEDYGLVSTYSTWVMVLNTFICLNLFITVRTAYIDFKDKYEEYNSSVMLLCIISGVVTSCIIVKVARIFGMKFSHEEILLACIQSIGLNLINYMLAIQAMKNDYKQRTFMMIVPNWVHTIISIILMHVFAQELYLAKIVGNAVGIIAFGIVCVIMIVMRTPPKIVPAYWKYALRISIPSIFNTLSDLILIQSDRLMITSMVGAEETAEYSVIYNVSSIIVAIYQAINGAWLPWFYKKVELGMKGDIKRYQGYYMLAFSVFSCGMMTVSPELVKIISPKNYWNGILYVAPIVVASYLIFLYTFFSSYLLYLKRTVIIAMNTIIAAALNIGLNYELIKNYRSAGAVVATVVSYIVLFFLYFFSIGKYGRNYFSIREMWLNIFGVAVYGIVFSIVRDKWEIRYSVYLMVVLAIYILKGKCMIKEFIGDK